MVTLGIIGLILPIMPGWVFLIPGLIILSDYFAWARRLTEWAKQKAHWGKNHGDDRSGSETRRDAAGDR